VVAGKRNSGLIAADCEIRSANLSSFSLSFLFIRTESQPGHLTKENDKEE
jgi:hypothetical protein